MRGRDDAPRSHFHGPLAAPTERSAFVRDWQPYLAGEAPFRSRSRPRRTLTRRRDTVLMRADATISYRFLETSPETR